MVSIHEQSPEIVSSEPNEKEIQETKDNVATEHDEIMKPGAPQMRSKDDDLGVWETVKQYKLITTVAMAAAFAASLDGYRESFSLLHSVCDFSARTSLHEPKHRMLTKHLHRNKSQRRNRLEQGIHSTIRKARYQDHCRKIRFCMGRNSIRWSNHRTNRKFTLISLMSLQPQERFD
ncbi:MAG: hypothetical protein CL912_10045 [Deltaproteobacteria bacterium]|nr:hypothetical protein [Deltaproteobacteria bacterium]